MPLDFPTTPVDGQVYDNYYYDAVMGTWRGYGTISAVVPAGVISQYAGSTAPSGYLLCTGQSLLTADYPALFAAIGYQYGGSGANFSLPDLQNRVPVGKGSDTAFDTLGETGGSKTHTLTVDEMPSHTHIQNSHNHTQDSHNHTQNAHSHTWSTDAGGGGIAYGWAGVSSAIRVNTYNYTLSPSTSSTTATNIATTATNQATTATNQNTGGGLAHNNLQPYIVLNYIIKT